MEQIPSIIGLVVIVSGLLGTITVFFIKRIIDKVDDIVHIKPLIEEVKKLVGELQELITDHQVSKKEIDMRFIDAFRRIELLEDEIKEIKNGISKSRMRSP